MSVLKSIKIQGRQHNNKDTFFNINLGESFKTLEHSIYHEITRLGLELKELTNELNAQIQETYGMAIELMMTKGTVDIIRLFIILDKESNINITYNINGEDIEDDLHNIIAISNLGSNMEISDYGLPGYNIETFDNIDEFEVITDDNYTDCKHLILTIYK